MRSLDKSKYDKYLQDFLSFVNNNNINGGYNLFKFCTTKEYKKSGLPQIRWFIKYCPNKNVNDINSFKEWCGLYQNTLTEQQCIDYINSLSEEERTNLKYDDFRNPSYGKPSVDIIKKYWGTLNNMKKELCIPITTLSKAKLSNDEYNKQITILKEYYSINEKEFISTSEISKICDYSCDTLRRYCKETFNITLKEYLSNYNIKIGSQGRGIVHCFDDGEKTYSQFEFLFSKFLKDNNFVFGVDYFRDVKYKTFCTDYNHNTNCDYMIIINGVNYYIEIAGIIGSYKKNYYSNTPIVSSKSKEMYRVKLMEKERLLKENKCSYFILFPCDLSYETLKSIISYPSNELRKSIESFNQGNIDWLKVRKHGALNYDDKSIIRNTVAWRKDNENKAE